MIFTVVRRFQCRPIPGSAMCNSTQLRRLELYAAVAGHYARPWNLALIGHRTIGQSRLHHGTVSPMANVVLKHVDKTYPGDIRGVLDLNLEVSEGEFVVLVGPSGCGKTTTL